MDENSLINNAPESNIGTFTSSKVDFSYPALVMRAINDCIIKRSVEMKEGYFNEKLDRQGNVRREWIPDTRKIFIASVDGLKDLLAPEIKKDEEFKKIIASQVKKNKQGKYHIEKVGINQRLKNVFDEFAYEKMEQTKEGWKKTGFKYLPQINEAVAILSVKHENKFLVVAGGWDDKVNSYHDSRIPIYDELLSELVNVAQRTGYFKKQSRAG